MTAAKTTPIYYVSTSNNNRVRVSFWPGEIEMHVSMTLTEGEARRLAASLIAQADTLPRVASAADLGLEAA